MRVPYHPSDRLYQEYYQTQVGRGLPVFVGGSQRGRGIGGVLGGLFRAALPLIKSGGKRLLKEGAKAGLAVAQDVLAGQNLKKAAGARAKQAGKRLLQQVVAPPPPPGAPPRKRIKKTKAASSGQRRKGSRKRRRVRSKSDIFG